jgi:hypothetical protein
MRLHQERGRWADAEEEVPIMANVACFCGRCFSFAGNAGACPECGEAVTLTTASAFVDHAESVCVPHWNGLPSAEPSGWDDLLPEIAGRHD